TRTRTGAPFTHGTAGLLGFCTAVGGSNRAFTLGQPPGNCQPERLPAREGPSAPAQGDVMIKAEYIWIDGTEPTARLRSKTKILKEGAELPIWGFDGSSTTQAPGSNSDCVLKPVFSCPAPIRGGDDVLVMTEVLLPDMTPHVTNTRALLRPIAEKYAKHEPLF